MLPLLANSDGWCKARLLDVQSYCRSASYEKCARARRRSRPAAFASVLQNASAARLAQLFTCLRCMRLCRGLLRAFRKSTKNQSLKPAHRFASLPALRIAALELLKSLVQINNSSLFQSQGSTCTATSSHAPVCSPAGLGRSARAVVVEAAAAQPNIHRRRRARDHGDQGRAAEVPLERRGAITRGARRHPTSVQRRRH